MAVEFLGPELAGLAVGIFVAGLSVLATLKWRGEGKLSEPGTSIGAALVYAPLAYAATSFEFIPGTTAPTRLVVLLVGLFLFHTYVLLSRWFRRHSTPKTLLRERAVPSHAISASAVSISRNAREYRETIVALEMGAVRLDRIPKRLAVVFKSSDTVRSIAIQRFGSGSDSMRSYVEEHDERTREFYKALGRGCSYREIYSREELKDYVVSRRHGSRAVLTAENVRDGLHRWIDCIEKYDSYQVGLTDEKLPFKYELVDRRVLVLHEALGENDRGRVNALVVEDVRVANDFEEDFNSIWERIEPKDRQKQNVAAWISSELLAII